MNGLLKVARCDYNQWEKLSLACCDPPLAACWGPIPARCWSKKRKTAKPIGENMETSTKCPVMGGTRNRTHGGWGHVESRLVAESVEPADPSSELAHEQSDGRGFQLRRGVQETRPGCLEEGHQSVDDDVAGLVAGRLRPLWAAVHSDGLAQCRHVSHRRRPRRRIATARNALRPSTVGPTMRTSTRPVGCSGRSSRSTAGKSRGPT